MPDFLPPRDGILTSCAAAPTPAEAFTPEIGNRPIIVRLNCGTRRNFLRLSGLIPAPKTWRQTSGQKHTGRPPKPCARPRLWTRCQAAIFPKNGSWRYPGLFGRFSSSRKRLRMSAQRSLRRRIRPPCIGQILREAFNTLRVRPGTLNLMGIFS